MPSWVQQIGAVVKAYREDRGLTQQELASQVTPATNRSVIAHLEQGLRVPPRLTLTTVCRFLRVPQALWVPLLDLDYPGFRLRNLGSDIVGFRLLAVSGPSGSGKSTLARALAKSLGFQYISGSDLGKQFLRDQTTAPDRWAFSTQVAFLTDKAKQLASAVRDGRPVVLDRTLSEDSDIYANYFIRAGDIDERSAVLYKDLAAHLHSGLPTPDLVIHCECSFETALLRLKERSREDLSHHTERFLKALDVSYARWKTLFEDSPMYVVDTQLNDVRDAVVVSEIAAEARQLISPGELAQGVLFPELQADAPTPSGGRYRLQPRGSKDLAIGHDTSARQPYRLIAPLAYIGAPFTSMAEAKESSSSDDLLPLARRHGVIPRGNYRNMLLQVESALRRLGVEAVIPHRDVNRWGNKSLTAAAAMAACTSQVSACDLFVGILGESAGTHYEFGIARGLGKPVILLYVSELPTAFIGLGAEALTGPDLLTVRAASMRAVAPALATDKVRQFLSRHFAL